MSAYRRLLYLRWGLLVLNLILVLAYAALMMIASSYAAWHGTALELLQAAGHVFGNPTIRFGLCMVIYLVLSSILLYQPDWIPQGGLQILVMLLCVWIIFLLQGAYNGLLLMAFCFFLPAEKPIAVPWSAIFWSCVLFFLTQFDVLSIFWPMAKPQAFVNIFSRRSQMFLNLFYTTAGTLNLIGFLVYLSVFLLDQFQRSQNIEKELEMVSAVNTELKNYAAITEKIGEDKERKRLAREIHDTLGHALTGIAAGIDACLVLIDMDPAATKKQLTIVSRVVRQGITDVRNSLNKLRPGALEANGFRQALEKMIQEFMDVSSMTIELDYRLEEFDFDVTKEDMLFRMVQESITNSLRHGHATKVEISMYASEDQVILSIQDNGKGCLSVVPGYGLRQMKERAAMLGGSISFDGSDGFRTEIHLPIKRGEGRGESVYDSSHHSG